MNRAARILNGGGHGAPGESRIEDRFPKMQPTIIMTGFPDPSVELFARRLGAVRVLRKPLDEEQMSALVLEAAMLGSRARKPPPPE